MRAIQFQLPNLGRRVGLLDGADVVDLTAANPAIRSIVDACNLAFADDRPLETVLGDLAPAPAAERIDYGPLLEAEPGSDRPFLLPPLDHPDPHRVMVSGTGLTHTGSMESRDRMHGGDDEREQEPQTDSARMFAMGIAGGKPLAGRRGVAPEWFYKGNGSILRGPRGKLELPAFALDGGEEPELVGCYVIDPHGRPRRLGFALGNEWSDHATERLNYLYLAPSKLRTCSVGPELVTDCAFDEVDLRCMVTRGGKTIYDSGVLKSGERFMCHSLANCEDHHFKYPQHRIPGDVHLHFFGTSRLSYGERNWKYEAGDEIRITAPGFGADLVNSVVAGDESSAMPIRVEPA